MQAIVLVIMVLLWFVFGYFFYSKFIDKQLINASNRRITPANRFKNNIDYKPSRKPFLFGHHFASIAGAGPIIGPILAVSYFGWLFVIFWITLGSVFIGAIHDYLSLMLSVRHKGEGIAKVSEKIIGKKTFYIFSILLWLTLMLIITVFSVSSADSLISVPQLVIPFFGITLTAVLLGLAIYKYNENKVFSTLIAVFMVVLFIWLGIQFPISLPFSLAITKLIWIVILFIYCLAASLLPVWVLLQPRDYLSAISLFSFLFLGLISVIIANPTMNAPSIIPYSLSQIPLWPILFITVACGAVSGFHALVASGTTSKQLNKEKDGRPIGYGAMLTEGIVALLVVIFISAGLKWGETIPGNLNYFSNALEAGWIIAFGNGFANIVNQVFPFLQITLLVTLGSLIVNIFILTSLDTSTRIGRMIGAEILPDKSKFNNKLLLTLLILIPAFLLAITNSYATIWQMFGSSNQLIAAVVLIAVSAYLVEHKKPIVYTIIPSIFMLITTIASLFYTIITESNIILTIISIILIIFALFVFIETLFKMRTIIVKRKNKEMVKVVKRKVKKTKKNKIKKRK